MALCGEILNKIRVLLRHYTWDNFILEFYIPCGTMMSVEVLELRLEMCRTEDQSVFTWDTDLLWKFQALRVHTTARDHLLINLALNLSLAQSQN